LKEKKKEKTTREKKKS